MKSVFKKGLRGRTLMVLAPLVLLVALAFATSGYITNSSAASCTYGNCGHVAPPSSYGVSNDALYVANGNAQNVAVIDVGTMSIVDHIPVPVQPNGLAGLGMYTETHGVVASKDRASIYAQDALSGGYLASAPYQLYQIGVKNGNVIRSIPLPTDSYDPVGYCGLEYALNDESSNELVATSMNASDATLQSIGAPNLGRPAAEQQGGWAYVDIANGTDTGFTSVYNPANGTNYESATCGIAWDASGTHAFASTMFNPYVANLSWSGGNGGANANASGTPVSFTAPPAAGRMYHQAETDKAKNLLYVTSEDGNIDVFNISTGTAVYDTTINIRALLGSTTSAIHSVDLSPSNSNVIYLTARHTPGNGDTTEVALDVSNLAAPQVIGAVDGLDNEACGVYAIPDKQDFYAAADIDNLSNDMLFVANGNANNVAVADVGTMSIVDHIPVPVQPAGLAGLGMYPEVHGVVASQDRTSIYAQDALSGGYLASAPYQLYNINSATGSVIRSIPLPTDSYDPVGYCGLEYALNDESSNELVATSMNASDATLQSIGAPNLGRPAAEQQGGWAYVDIANGTDTGFTSVYNPANGTNYESATCGIAWDASGTHAFASTMFNPYVANLSWSGGNGGANANASGTPVSFTAPPAAGRMYHQAETDKAKNLLYVTSEDGNIDVFNISTGTAVYDTTINIRALLGSTTSAIHSVDLSPSNSNVIYLTARHTPGNGDTTEVALDVSNLAAPKVIGSINGLDNEACGVYAIGDKQDFYGHKPSLSLSETRVYWASLSDYLAGKLSVDYSIANSDAAVPTNVAAGVVITGSNSTNGVTVATALPLAVGNIGGSSSAALTLQYNVPVGVTSFVTTTDASAQNGSAIFTY